MTAITKSRVGSRLSVNEAQRPLAAGAKVFAHSVAVCVIGGTSQGYYKQAAAGDVAFAVGRFTETVDNTLGADGALVANIDFFRDRWIHLLNNDGGTPVTVANREQPCWLLDDQTVTGAQNDALAGAVYDVTSEGVWVEHPGPVSAEAGGALIPALGKSVHAPVASIAALQAVSAQDRSTGMFCMITADGSFWRFHSTSTAADATNNLVITPTAGAGRWLRADKRVTLTLPVTFATADAAAIFTVPTGAVLHPNDSWWDVGTSWTGGSSSAIGVATSVTGFNTAGDMLGGAGGDVLATLVSTNVRMTGTVGTKLATRTLGRLVMNAADTFTFNRITSAFTAGAANVRVLVDVIANAGA